MDDILDCVARREEIGGDACGFVITERFLLADQAVETGFEIAHRDAQRRDRVLVHGSERGLDAVETVHRHSLAVAEIFDFVIGRTRDEIGRRSPHDEKPGLEIAAGVGHFGVAVNRLKGAADLDVARQVGDAVGEKADNRNDTEHDNAGAHR